MERIKYVSYKNLIQLISFWHDPKKKSFVAITEYVEFTSIADIMKKHKIGVPAARKWLSGVVAALDFLSSLSPPIPHGRINVDSIYIKMSTGSVKVQIPIPFYKDRKCFNFTYSTPPETLYGVYDILSDIWCLGLTALEVITGEEPYREYDTPEKLFHALISGVLPESLKKVTDPDAYDFISKCLVDHDCRPMIADLVGHPFVNLNTTTMKNPISNEECEVLFSPKRPAANPNAINFALSHRRVSATEEYTLQSFASQAKEHGVNLTDLITLK
ncbi:STE family protein kinase [Tritrichomonas foetus]|uniref:STE family protein kinase n=1 Tax=Tritrichomonas foetus TaxID=1144522 RepID=A0A1J4JC51_9EUKA|nr:STE family protein kinase [Tritrichomonas foetus]|eukprot:OHS94836.1 STE family protein kinase [Tritrichomonas foetus]